MGCNCGQKYRPPGRRATPRTQVATRRSLKRPRMQEKKTPTVVPQQDAGLETQDPRGPIIAATGQLASVMFGGEGGAANVLCRDEENPAEDKAEGGKEET